MLCLIYLIGLYIKVKHIYVGIFFDVLYNLVSLTVQVFRHHWRLAILLYVQQAAIFISET